MVGAEAKAGVAGELVVVVVVVVGGVVRCWWDPSLLLMRTPPRLCHPLVIKRSLVDFQNCSGRPSWRWTS